MRGQCFNGVDGWLLMSVGLDVEAVEVPAEGVHAEVPVEDAVHVDHGHDHEHEHLPQQMRPQVLLVGEEVDHSLHCVGGRSLPRVHSGSDQHHWLLEPLRPRLFGKQRFLEQYLVLLFVLVVGGDGEEMDGPVLRRLDEHFLVEIELIIADEVVEPIQVLHQLLVLVGIAEGELNTLLLAFECIFDRAF
jgi:hypothetical protein